MPARFCTLDVFTDRPFGGNPLAVFPDASDIAESDMQRIAREMNLSETVFVLPARLPEALRRLRIFTPGRELPFAGHPTIGTAHLLFELGIARATDGGASFVLEEGVGPVPITVRPGAARELPLVELTAGRLPERGPDPPPSAEIAATLGLRPDEILAGADRPVAYSCGLPFLFVPIASRAALGRARVDSVRWRKTLADYWAPQIFVFCREPELSGSDFRARMFAPGDGIEEDPATGSAAAALAGYLDSRETAREGSRQWVIEQGFEMGRPSILRVTLEWSAGSLAAVRVGGTAVRMCEGELRLSPEA